MLKPDEDEQQPTATAKPRSERTRHCKQIQRRVDRLGCGPGTYAFHLGVANPDLRLFLLDLPGVWEFAKEVQQRFELTNEVTFVPLDAVDNVVPGTYDLVLVSNTLHMLGERHSRDLIRRLYPTVNEGGSLVVQAQFLRDDRMGARWPSCWT